MNEQYIEDQKFTSKDYSEVELTPGEYENCSFLNCNFSGGSVAGFTFSECEFTDCDLSNLEVQGTSFRDVIFRNCKMLGLRFDECNHFLLSFNFEDCLLNFSSFYKLKLKKTKFSNCKLKQADFSEADFSGSSFQKCDFSCTIFSGTNLQNVSMETSYNFSIDPETNNIKKAKFSAENISGLLDKYQIIIK